MIAALYVQMNGCYFGLPDVDPWDEVRDARNYEGPYPVVAHPPCARWGRYWNGGHSAKVPRLLGDDDGKFASALAAVRRWGGILEHPEGSHAWRHFGLNVPLRGGGWSYADWEGGWTCCVEQGNYGHRAAKATWLYACKIGLPPSLKWGRSGNRLVLREGEDLARIIKTGVCQRMSKRQREATPIGFRDLLLSMVRNHGLD
jgi:hypothetical protein